MNYFLQAALHLRHVLELKPNYGPALSALADMEAIPDTSVHLYTVVIIVFLVAAVLIWVLSTLDYGVEEMLGIRCVHNNDIILCARMAGGKKGPKTCVKKYEL